VRAVPEPRFVFVLVRPGAEVLAKAELGRAHPSLRPSFSRPGLLTLKDPSGEVTEQFGADLVFARAAGLSLGIAADVPAIVERAPAGLFVLSVTGREGPPPADLHRELRAALGDRARLGPAAVGDLGA
jgi:hypothetical protein